MQEQANRRVLSDADLHALRDMLHAERQCAFDDCTFDEASRVALKRLSRADPNVLIKIADMADNATNYVLKGLLALAFIALLALALFGASVKAKFGL